MNPFCDSLKRVLEPNKRSSEVLFVFVFNPDTSQLMKVLGTHL